MGRILPGFRHGLSETGYVEGQNIAIEYRMARESIRSIAGTHRPIWSAYGPP